MGTLMISTKRYVQASEIFRKIQSDYLKEIDELNSMHTNMSPRSLASTYKSSSQKQRATGKTQTNSEVQRLFLKCAGIELLIAESMCQSNQISEKLLCLKRACDLFLGKPVPPNNFMSQIFLQDDPYTGLMKMLPSLLKLLLTCVSGRREIVRVATMKLIEFVLETKGCSLESSIIVILKVVLKTYPTNAQ